MDIIDILETETSAMTGVDMTHDNGDTSTPAVLPMSADVSGAASSDPLSSFITPDPQYNWHYITFCICLSVKDLLFQWKSQITIIIPC